MKYKLIAADFDGTLLKNDLTVSQNVVNAINEYRKAGGVFTISTGRFPEALEQYFHQLGFDKLAVPMVCNMGTQIYLSGENAKTLKIVSIDEPDKTRLAQWFIDRGIYLQVVTDKGTRVEAATDITSKYKVAVGIEIEEVGNLAAFCHNTKENVQKMLGIFDVKDIKSVQEGLRAAFPSLKFILSTAPLLQGLKTDTFNPTMIECVNASVDKGVGIKYIADMLGIDLQDVIAVGDSFNDIDMIKAAGMGVAMGNACDEVKQCADYVTDTNENDGVAKMIREIALKGV